MSMQHLTMREPTVSTVRAAGRLAWQELALVLGLAAVFLVNAIVAAVEPESFADLVDRSRLAQLAQLDSQSWVTPLIGAHDLAVGAVLFASLRRRDLRAKALAWSGVWLAVVTAVKLTALV